MMIRALVPPLLGLALFACGPTEAGVQDVSQESLLAALSSPSPPIVLDVRSSEEFAAGHVPGARNVPHDQVEARLDELMPHRADEVVVYCKSGRRAGVAIDVLSAAGFRKLRHLDGDMSGWQAAGLPVED